MLRAFSAASSHDSHNVSRIDALVHDHAKEREHHFFPRHVTVVDRLVRIRIEFVVCGIIVMGANDEPCSFWVMTLLPQDIVEILGLPLDENRTRSSQAAVSDTWGPANGHGLSGGTTAI